MQHQKWDSRSISVASLVTDIFFFYFRCVVWLWTLLLVISDCLLVTQTAKKMTQLIFRALALCRSLQRRAKAQMLSSEPFCGGIWLVQYQNISPCIVNIFAIAAFSVSFLFYKKPLKILRESGRSADKALFSFKQWNKRSIFTSGRADSHTLFFLVFLAP